MRAMVSLLPGSRVDTASLKLAHPIAEVVARYGVELKRQGRAMVGRCIFHTDNGRPNLYVYGDSESWRCYRCGIGGDVLAFVMHAENIAFREAVDRLTGGWLGPLRPASRPAPALRPASKGPDERTAEELAVLQAATNFYHFNLLAEPRALDYLAQRGISLATARECRLGYAAGNQLLAFLHWQRLPLGAALQLGLLTRAGHEFMAGRIVIPELCAGRPMWLIGRALAEDLADDVPRYLGLPGRSHCWDGIRPAARPRYVSSRASSMSSPCASGATRWWGCLEPTCGPTRSTSCVHFRGLISCWTPTTQGSKRPSLSMMRSAQPQSRSHCQTTSRTLPNSPRGLTARPFSPRHFSRPSANRRQTKPLMQRPRRTCR